MKRISENLTIITISLTSGGAEKVISLLLKALRYDYDVTLVLLYNVVHFPIPEHVKVKVLCAEHSDRSLILKFYDFFKATFAYYRFVKTKDIAVSISFLALPNFINSFVAIFRSHKKTTTIISERGFPSDNTTSKLSNYISKVFYPILYNKCDKLFSNSIHINEDLKKNFGIKIPMEVIYNPIEVPNKTIVPKDLNTDKNSLKIITAGTLNTRKNQIMIIRALNEIDNKDSLQILGAGHLYDYLKKEISNLNLNHQITLEGKVKDVNGYLLNSNCFVLSSFTEGFPNALLEAMAIGLPCISTNCLSGPLELLNENEPISIDNGEFYIGKYGLLVNNDDHIGLSKALEFYRNNSNNRANN